MSRPAPDIAALERAITLARDWVAEEAVAGAERVVTTARERAAIYDDFIVVALAGGTGSGKSSLFNRVIGRTLSAVGVRRPTTSTTSSYTAADAARAAPLLDYLDVRARHSGDGELPAEAVLLDLPDHDSDAIEHRLELDRLIDRIDVLVWVVDPEKYADAELHDGYLRPLADHAGTFVVALNQIDLLEAGARREITGDLTRLLADAGLGRARLIAVSAMTGEGVDDLRAEIAARVAGGAAAREKLAADLAGAARRLGEACGAPVGEPQLGDDLRDRIAAAVGAGEVERLAAANYAADAAGRLSWFGRSWWRRGSATIRRWVPFGGSPPLDRSAAHEVVVPPVRGGAAIQVRSLALEPLAQIEGRLPAAWAHRARQEAQQRADRLPVQLDDRLRRIDFHYRRPRWWRLWSVVQNLLGLIAAAGLAWLLGLAGLALLKFPQPPLPEIGEVPIPTAMLIGAVIVSGLLGLLGNGLARAGRRRQRHRAGDEVRAVVAEVLRQEIGAPLAAHAARQRELLAELKAVAG